MTKHSNCAPNRKASEYVGISTDRLSISEYGDFVTGRFNPLWEVPESITNNSNLYDKPKKNEKKVETWEIFLSLGGNSTGLGFHDHEQAWNVAIHGERRWFVFNSQAEDVEKVAHKHRTADDFWKAHSTSSWYENIYPKLPRSFKRAIKQCVQRRGDAVYVPENWQHAVINSGCIFYDFFIESGCFLHSVWLGSIHEWNTDLDRCDAIAGDTVAVAFNEVDDASSLACYPN